jgi:methylmalonyl-CoA mutase cobalamin-binding domain/chain
MVTHKERLLSALHGETTDVMPYAPRIDLWYLANSTAGTLPEKHRGRTQREIAVAEGWAFHHKFADDLLGEDHDEEYRHRGLGILKVNDVIVDFKIPTDVEVKWYREGNLTTVEYHTPVGMVSNTMEYSKQMQFLGISIPHVTDHLIKSKDDYPAAYHLFEHMEVVPRFDRFMKFSEEIGDNGVPVTSGFYAPSPVNQIQRDLIDPTQFYFHYNDYQKEIRGLAERMEHLFDDILKICCDSPADMIMWGANYDDMLTYPPYFEKELMPWIRKASDALGARGKLVMCHTDGENFGLMDLIRDSGMHVAESICPHPMTRLTLAEYYQRWSGHLTLFGGVPSTVVLADTPVEQFDAYMDDLFKAVAPGNRMVVGIADQVPPKVDFDRLVRIGERIAEEGRLPLEAGAFRPVSEEELGASTQASPRTMADAPAYKAVQNDVIDGDDGAIIAHVQELLDKDFAAQDILDHGLVKAMGVIGGRFACGEVFIPEVLLSSRAMNEAVNFLGPYLAQENDGEKGRVLIGTVNGDMHDIGKSMVVTMLKGVGFEVFDLGTNVSEDAFMEKIAEFNPDILGLSALLTTTMTEMGNVIRKLNERNLRGKVKVMVGGAPVSEQFANEIGADGFAADAATAVDVAKRLVDEA